MRGENHSDTSREAKRLIRANTDRACVYQFLRSRWKYGATDDELQRYLPIDGNTERPRRVELVRAGLVKDSGKRRKTSSGRKAIVWVVR